MRQPRHKISLDNDTFSAIQRWASYVNRVTGKPISAAKAIKLLACGTLDIKTEIK